MKKKPPQPATPPLATKESEALLSGILGVPPSSPREVKPDIDAVIEKGQRLLKPLKEVSEGYARGDRLVTNKEFYDRYKDGPSSKWCPDSPDAVDRRLTRLGMVPVISGKKGRGNNKKWWQLKAKRLLIKDKKKGVRSRLLKS